MSLSLCLTSTGRDAAEALGYPPELLDGLPPEAVDGFTGTGAPFAVARLRPAERVVVLGCGTGTDAFAAAAQVGPRGHVTGVDASPDRLDLAESLVLGEPVEFRHARLERLPFAARSFDVAIANGAIARSPNRRAAIAEAARVLRPHGRLVAVDTVPDRAGLLHDLVAAGLIPRAVRSGDHSVSLLAIKPRGTSRGRGREGRRRATPPPARCARPQPR